jgi:hypothetical protein
MLYSSLNISEIAQQLVPLFQNFLRDLKPRAHQANDNVTVLTLLFLWNKTHTQVTIITISLVYEYWYYVNLHTNMGNPLSFTVLLLDSIVTVH